MGELAFTRDTGRLFVGDNSDNIGEHAYLQSTVGGILVGNKYLGMVDSKPLATFTDNATPLSYESNTHFSGSKEIPAMEEKALLKSESKFREKSAAAAKEKWSNWPRESQYNKTYNAYNGDYMFDPYQSAFIFFDNRISGLENSPTQPVVKKDSQGVPVSPETFIVDGKEVPSNDPKAIDVKRRTKTVNYMVNGEDKSTFPIYGDGYVIARILEPDNITIKVKKREFSNNGDPLSGNNISHNILTIGDIPLSNMTGSFGDDFIVGDKIQLNKNIKNVKSITAGSANGLKVPQSLIFSTPAASGGATGNMKWNFSSSSGSTFQSGKQYELVLVYNGTEKDADFSSNSYPNFNLQLKEKVNKVETYYINLGKGLVSSQTNNKKIILDEKATVDGGNVPLLSVESADDTGRLELTEEYDEYTNPYNTEADINFDEVYSSNFGIYGDGTIGSIDEYDQKYYKVCKNLIDKWEGQNSSLNFIRKPITILSTSTDATLFSSTGEENIATLKTGVNAYVDFYVDPYIYCGHKIISSPSTLFLPKVTDINNFPDKTNSTYFNSFTNTNIKAWNSLVTVLGNNHYKSLTNKVSTKFFIDGFTGDKNKTDCVGGRVYKTRSNIKFDDKYQVAPSRPGATEQELSSIAFFGWEKRETNGQVTWSVLEKFDTRSDSDKEFYGDTITKVCVLDGGDNILSTTNQAILEVVSQEKVGSVTTKITKRFLMPEASVLSNDTNKIITRIVYGTDEWERYVDLTKNGLINYSHSIDFSKDASGAWTDYNGYTVTSLDILESDHTTITKISAADTKKILDSCNGKITSGVTYNNKQISSSNILVFICSNGGETIKNYYMPVGGFYYAMWAALPTTIQKAKIKESNFTEVTIDERIQDASKVVLPAHAQSIILEVEHKTTDASPVGIFYANEFRELGLLISGLATQESSNTNSYLNTSITNSVYTQTSGVYKQSMGVSVGDSDTTKSFHSLSKSIADNEKLSPSCFCAATNEKPIFLSNTSETRLIEVPIHKSNYSSLKHFCLRLSNIRPTTSSAKNSVAIRVIGYRV